MSLLFYIDEKQGLILRPECVKLCPNLSILKEKELLYIILAYDYQSPYRQFPEHERKRKAMFHAFDDNVPELLEKQSIKVAITDYISLQYDRRIELIKQYQKKIDQYLKLWETDDNPGSAMKLDAAINVARTTIKNLEKEVTESIVNKGVIRGGGELSLLEELLANQKLFKSVTAIK